MITIFTETEQKNLTIVLKTKRKNPLSLVHVGNDSTLEEEAVEGT